MRQALLMILLATMLSACGTTVSNQYTITGDRNSFKCDSVAAPLKTVDTSLGASVAATAAASQQGPATNSGSSEAQAVEGQR